MAKLGTLEKCKVVLKYCGLTTKEIVGDVNSEKIDCFTTEFWT